MKNIEICLLPPSPLQTHYQCNVESINNPGQEYILKKKSEIAILKINKEEARFDNEFQSSTVYIKWCTYTLIV